VLHEVQQKHLTQVAAAARLKVTDRQVRPCHQTATRHHQTLTRHGHLSVSQQDQYLPGIYFRGLLLALRRTHGGSPGYVRLPMLMVDSQIDIPMSSRISRFGKRRSTPAWTLKLTPHGTPSPAAPLKA
jgi:hypothetical protein